MSTRASPRSLKNLTPLARTPAFIPPTPQQPSTLPDLTVKKCVLSVLQFKGCGKGKADDKAERARKEHVEFIPREGFM